MALLSPSHRAPLLDRTRPASLSNLANDLLMPIFLHLHIGDILRVRQTCKSLNLMTKDKLVWIYLLRDLIAEKNIPLPPYTKPIATLTTEQVEALTRRATWLAHRWSHDMVRPQAIVKLDIPRTITWLRLICGRWLFVASFDTQTSCLCCWDVEMAFRGEMTPVAECFFSGPVRSAQLELQANCVVIAVSVESRSPAIQVLSFGYYEDQQSFVLHTHLSSFSHVKLLHGDFIGCLMKDGVSIPQLINWRTKVAYSLANLPDVNGAALAMTVWNDYIVIVRPRDVQIYTLPLDIPSFELPSQLQTLLLEHMVWEAVFLVNANFNPSIPGLLPKRSEIDLDHKIYILISCQSEVHLYTLSSGTSTGDSSVPGFTLESVSNCIWTGISWGFTAGTTGRMITWFSAGPPIGRSGSAPPTISAATLSQFQGENQLSHKLLERIIDIGDADRLPATWAIPQSDFDETLGLLAIGNSFGELAICDYVKQPLKHLSSLADDFTAKLTKDLIISSKKPVAMSIPSIGYLLRRDTIADVVADGELSGGSIKIATEDIPRDWTNKWSHFGDLDDWQGFPNDMAWSIRHCWNFIGQPELLLYRRHNEGSTIFRAGGLYFVLAENDLYVFHTNVTFLDILHALCHDQILNIISDEPLELNIAARIQGEEFRSFSHSKVRDRGRDRRKEQMERGGFPHSTVFSKKNGVWTYANPDYQQHAREECHPSDEESEDSGASEEYTSGQDDQNSNDEESGSSQEGDEGGNHDGSNTGESAGGDKSDSACGDADTQGDSPDVLKTEPESRDTGNEDISGWGDTDKRSNSQGTPPAEHGAESGDSLPSTGGLHPNTSAENSVPTSGKVESNLELLRNS